MNWADLLPETVADQQHRWEERHRARRAREAGARIKHIAKYMNYHPASISQMVAKARKEVGRLSPVEAYLRRCEVTLKNSARSADSLKTIEFVRYTRHPVLTD